MRPRAATRVALMYEGRLLAFDTPQHLVAALPNRILEVRCGNQRVARTAPLLAGGGE